MTHGIGRALPTHELKKVFSESEIRGRAPGSRGRLTVYRLVFRAR
jgi:hypothetical protein